MQRGREGIEGQWEEVKNTRDKKEEKEKQILMGQT